MIIAYHIILTAYGFWLPNDPRGSWSTAVWAKHLRPFGQATKVDTHRSLAKIAHNHKMRHDAKRNLKYPPVSCTGVQARATARGFATIVKQLDMTVHACAV